MFFRTEMFATIEPYGMYIYDECDCWCVLWLFLVLLEPFLYAAYTYLVPRATAASTLQLVVLACAFVGPFLDVRTSVITAQLHDIGV